ncbi:methyl-accepting chemotaxis protein [Pseudomonas sp. UL073]|uniref:Methyl-accepting chemotaxis protein n=1 Tax=Zestomonas insulae TaxID=2809017 RepID=A0ABS2IDR2_9GAMM|nr:methyl-accepting chemotaxis protein [Pseudomonas insulae]MBM7061112.1 methyl-accepting chemotaxis protein [Pseudomonas insulae]
MFKWFTDALGNVSVNRKLALGFGIVLALTLMVALIGWLNMSTIISRGDKLASLAQLNLLAKDLRIFRLGYQSSREAEDKDAVLQTLDKLDQHNQQLLGRLSDPQDRLLLDKLGGHISDYRSSFTALVKTFDNREAARQTLIKQAAAVADSMIKVEQDILGDVDNAVEQRLQDLHTFAQFSRQVMQARFQAFSYTSGDNQAQKAAALAGIDQAIEALRGLRGQVGSGHEAELDESAAALSTYRTTLAAFSAEIDASLAARETMVSLGGQIEALSDELGDRQAAKRDAAAEHARLLIGLGVALALLLGIAAAWTITRQIVNPLNDTLAAATRIASGDLSQDIRASRHDELGQLQQAMQRMTLSLRELVGRIHDGVTQIASAAEELSAVTEQTSAGVNSQKVETDQVATAMNEMAATVQEVARNAEQASAAAAEADREASQGDRVVSDAIAQMDRLASEVQGSAQAMEQLKQESAKIGSVLDVIKSVAEQTNLLALNAAIEAARAGEAGRGFAVVADEVRGLAQRTQKSTEEIEELIAGLHSGTQAAASRMDSSRDLAGRTVELARKAGDALASINQRVSSIQAMNLQIAAAAEEQSAVAEEINRSVISVRDISEQTAAASEETAASSTELARLGGELQALVNGFRL